MMYPFFEKERKEKIMKKKESIQQNVFFICVACVIAILIPFQIDGRQVADALGARFFPALATALVLIPNVIQLVSKLIRNSKAKAAGQLETVEKASNVKLGDRVNDLVKKYWLVAAVAVLAMLTTFAIDYIGYIVTYSVMTCFFLVLFKEKRWYFYAISIVLVILVYLFFSMALNVPLP